MTEPLYLLTIGLPLATILIVFGMRYFAMIQQAQARLANDDAYRQTAERSAAAEAETAAALSAIQASMADTATRLAAIETVLKTVE